MAHKSEIHLKRAYDPASKEDGMRILVDRLWPRGIAKAKLKADLWLKEIAPSQELRKWFCHDPEKWGEFQKEYFKELRANKAAVQTIRDALKSGPVTLLYAAHDPDHNNALCLKHFLEKSSL